MGQSFCGSQKLIIEANGRTHASKHTDEASICQIRSFVSFVETRKVVERVGPLFFALKGRDLREKRPLLGGAASLEKERENLQHAHGSIVIVRA